MDLKQGTSPIDEKIPAEVLKYFLDLIQENLNSSYQALNHMTVQIEELSQYLVGKPSNQDVIDRMTSIIRSHDNKNEKKFKELLNSDEYKESYLNILNKIIEISHELKNNSELTDEHEKKINDQIKEIKQTLTDIMKMKQNEYGLFNEIKDDVKLLNGKFDKMFWGVLIAVTVLGGMWAFIERMVVAVVK